jgi:hypothetical protein
MIVLVIQWEHVLLGIVWFGGTLNFDDVVIPALMTLPLEQQRAVSRPLTLFTNRLLFPASILVILLGLVRGTLFGPVQSWNFLIGTAYGLTFLVASLAAVVTFLWGHFVIDPAARRLDAFPLTEVAKPGGAAALAFAAQVNRLKVLSILQMLGFFVIFTCMILMRFGL